MKLVLLICFLIYVKCFILDDLSNYTFYVINETNYEKINVYTNISSTLMLKNILPYYGYVNNYCLNSIVLCNNPTKLLNKYFFLNTCDDFLLSSCNGYTSLNEYMCLDIEKCSSYNSTISIKYLFNIYDVKCFFNYKIINTKIEYIYSSQYILNISFLSSFNNYDNIFLEGESDVLINNTLKYLNCNITKNINYFYNNLNTNDFFNNLNNFITTYNIDYNISNFNYSIFSYDENLKKYNSLKKINTYISLESLNMYYPIKNIPLNIDIQDNLTIKLYNQGCWIYNVLNDSYSYNLYYNCFDDTLTYISFSLVFDNDTFSYTYFVDNKGIYAFKLKSVIPPNYLVNFGFKKEILHLGDLTIYNDTNIIQGDTNEIKTGYNDVLLSIMIYSFLFCCCIIFILLVVILKIKKCYPFFDNKYYEIKEKYNKLLQEIRPINVSNTIKKQIEEMNKKLNDYLFVYNENQNVNSNKVNENSYLELPEDKQKLVNDYKKKYPSLNNKFINNENTQFIDEMIKKDEKILINEEEELSSIDINDSDEYIQYDKTIYKFDKKTNQYMVRESYKRKNIDWKEKLNII